MCGVIKFVIMIKDIQELPNAPLCTEIGNVLLIKYGDKTYEYKLETHFQPVNKQQFELPKGYHIKYGDGSIFHHFQEYLLLRNWRMPNGEIQDRVAFPWNNLYLSNRV